jgi:hypothetical protein
MQLLIALSIIAFIVWLVFLIATIIVYGLRSDTALIKWIEETYDPELAEINSYEPKIIRPGGYGRFEKGHLANGYFVNGYFANQSLFPLLLAQYTIEGSSDDVRINSIVPVWYKSHRMLRQIETDIRNRK